MNLRITLFSILLLTIYSCTHSINPTLGIHYVYEYNSINYSPPLKRNQHLDVLVTASQFFTINPTNYNTIYGSKGSVISIPKNCWCDQKNEFVTDYIQFELKELTTKIDMVLSNKPTVSNGKILISGGTIYLNAQRNGEPLSIGCSEGIQVKFPTENLDTEMAIFVLKNNEWKLDTSEKVSASSSESWDDWDGEEYENESYLYSNYLFNTKKLGWINIDKFYHDDRPKSKLMVKLNHTIKKEEGVSVYALFKNLNAVLPIYGRSGNIFQTDQLPVGEEIEIFAISANKEIIYVGSKTLTLNQQQVVSIDLSLSSKEALLDKSNLP